ncbi:MAG TPA: cytochrome c [Anaerolineae bacterium]
MLINLLMMLVFLALLVLFAWLFWRSWKSKRWFLKWPGLILAGLLTLLLAFVSFSYGKGLLALYAPKPVAAVNITVARTPEQIARGEHIASMLCASCHTTDGNLPLSGGKDLSEDTPLPLGTIFPPNITPGGKLAQLTDNDVFRILRTGVEPGGRLTFMAAFPVHNLSDEDAVALIAYLRTAPSVQKENPPAVASPLMVFLLGAGVVSTEAPATIQPVTAPPKGVTVEYGQYVKSFMDCTGCHGPTLSKDGGMLEPPNAANLTLIVPKWSKEEFFKTLRTGVDPTGHNVEPPMPWKTIGKLDDVEMEALYLYLHGLTPIVH